MPRFKSPILAVDDDETALVFYTTLLRHSDFSEHVLCRDSREVMPLLAARPVSAVLLDLNMPHVSGQQILQEIQGEHPEVPVIVVTAEDSIETAVECIRNGAFDYLVKPVQKNRLLASLKHAIEVRELKEEVGSLSRQFMKRGLRNEGAFAEIITQNRRMRDLFEYVEAVAPSPIPVLITGESGTGKELVARVIHKLSNRGGRFVPVNVAGLDDTMFLDTLFGHKRGAYTGADSDRKGLIEQARGGTIFLDEIGDLGHGSQVKLLRLLQEGEYYALGSDVATMCDARILAATNTDIGSRQASGNFRQDLFYRLATYLIDIPPLRERLDDIPLLADHFLDEAAATLGKKIPRVPQELHTLLQAYHYPGNVRELRSMILDALTRHESGILSTSFFKEYIDHRDDGDRPRLRPQIPADDPNISYEGRFPTMKEVEQFFMTEAMSRAAGNQSVAARLLGISQSTLSRRFSRKSG